jgi:hypothetical protein
MPDFNDQHFGIFSVKYNSSANRLILLQFGCQLVRINFDDLRAVLSELKEELVSLFLPLLHLLFAKNIIHIVVECFLSVVAESTGIFHLFLR